MDLDQTHFWKFVYGCVQSNFVTTLYIEIFYEVLQQNQRKTFLIMSNLYESVGSAVPIRKNYIVSVLSFNGYGMVTFNFYETVTSRSQIAIKQSLVFY